MTVKPLSSIPAWFDRYYQEFDLERRGDVELVVMDKWEFRVWSQDVSQDHEDTNPSRLPTVPHGRNPLIVKKPFRDPNNTQNSLCIPNFPWLDGVYTKHGFEYNEGGKGNCLVLVDCLEWGIITGMGLGRCGRLSFKKRVAAEKLKSEQAFESSQA